MLLCVGVTCRIVGYCVWGDKCGKYGIVCGERSVVLQGIVYGESEI